MSFVSWAYGNVHLQRAKAVVPAIQRLNPRVPIHADTEKIQDKSPEFFRKFDIVIATDLDLDSMVSRSGSRGGALLTHGSFL